MAFHFSLTYPCRFRCLESGPASRVSFQREITRIIARLTTTAFQDISHSLCQLYLEDERPKLVGFSGRDYSPPNRTFRWCTPRMKIYPVNDFSQSHRAIGLPDDLLNIPKDDDDTPWNHEDES